MKLGVASTDLDIVAFYDKPLLKFDRILETYLAYAPRGYRLFLKGLPLWLKQKLHTPRELDLGLNGQYRGRYIFTRHHESHAASAFFPSPFDEAAILTLDGVGEWTALESGRQAASASAKGIGYGSSRSSVFRIRSGFFTPLSLISVVFASIAASTS